MQEDPPNFLACLILLLVWFLHARVSNKVDLIVFVMKAPLESYAGIGDLDETVKLLNYMKVGKSEVLKNCI